MTITKKDRLERILNSSRAAAFMYDFEPEETAEYGCCRGCQETLDWRNGVQTPLCDACAHDTADELATFILGKFAEPVPEVKWKWKELSKYEGCHEARLRGARLVVWESTRMATVSYCGWDTMKHGYKSVNAAKKAAVQMAMAVTR